MFDIQEKDPIRLAEGVVAGGIGELAPIVCRGSPLRVAQEVLGEVARFIGVPSLGSWHTEKGTRVPCNP